MRYLILFLPDLFTKAGVLNLQFVDMLLDFRDLFQVGSLRLGAHLLFDGTSHLLVLYLQILYDLHQLFDLIRFDFGLITFDVVLRLHISLEPLLKLHLLLKECDLLLALVRLLEGLVEQITNLVIFGPDNILERFDLALHFLHVLFEVGVDRRITELQSCDLLVLEEDLLLKHGHLRSKLDLLGLELLNLIGGLSGSTSQVLFGVHEAVFGLLQLFGRGDHLVLQVRED